MKEAIFILLVVAVLIGITMIRYRRQITAAIRIYKLLKGQRDNSSEKAPKIREKAGTGSTDLVSCARCGRWVSRLDAVRISTGMTLCSLDCEGRPVRARRI